jgi:hypothetical protein
LTYGIDEIVALLCRKDIDNHIEVKLVLDEEDVTKAESKGTYENIKEYLLGKYGFKVSTLYIAQIKRKRGLDLGENYNKSKKDNPVGVSDREGRGYYGCTEALWDDSTEKTQRT